MIYPWQKTQWQQLMQQREQNRLPHAVLLYGDAGIGKAGFAHSLASSLLCRQRDASGLACGICSACKLIAAETHPDLVVLRPEAAKNTTSKKPILMIRIDTIRALCGKLAMTSQFDDGYRIAIVENADQMNLEAANALLKTLEEPGAKTQLILTSSHPSRLPVTVVSRCQGLRFPRAEPASALQWLTEQGLTQAELRLAQAHGAPLLALEQGGDSAEARKQLNEALVANMKHSALQHASKLASLPNHQLLSWMLDWVGDLVRLRQLDGAEARLINQDHSTALRGYASQIEIRRVYELYDQICDLIRAQSIALNAELLWESLLLSWQGLKK